MGAFLDEQAPSPDAPEFWWVYALLFSANPEVSLSMVLDGIRRIF